MTPLLSARITVEYRGRRVLENCALRVDTGEIVGLVGASGSGKSTLALALVGLLKYRGARVSGHVLFQGRELLACPERELRALRGREIALVLQSPSSSLNPAMRIGAQLAECWKAHRGGSRPEIAEHVSAALAEVSLPADAAFLARYPKQLSVGQAQRVLIAMAVLHRPAMLIADEPTSALDAITHAEIRQLLGDLNRRLGMGILYISHDLISVASLCHRVAILHQGRVVEEGAAERIFSAPADPYTRRLVAALSEIAGVREFHMN